MIKKLNLMLKNLMLIDKVIVISILLLCICNIIIQYSASDKNLHQISSDIIFLGLSFILLLITANININQIKSIIQPLYILSIILLVGVFLFGVSVNGARRWINIGLRIQPSEISKIITPLAIALYLSNKNKLTMMHYFVAFLILLVPVVLIVKQPDLGTGILVFLAGFFVIFFAGLSWRIILIASILFIAMTPIIWHFLHSYQQQRILTLINPQTDPLGRGYHIIQGMIAIGSGGLFGKGYLQGTQTHLNFIPEKSTDFVITVVAEEFGFIGIMIILMLYSLIIIRGLSIMRHSHDLFSQTIAGSISLSFMTYVIINMGMVSGIFPVVGVPLPLISYGGTATVIIMMSIGILLAINKNNKY
jgi:rod shape determining protein RodA